MILHLSIKLGLCLAQRQGAAHFKQPPVLLSNLTVKEASLMLPSSVTNRHSIMQLCLLPKHTRVHTNTHTYTHKGTMREKTKDKVSAKEGEKDIGGEDRETESGVTQHS